MSSLSTEQATLIQRLLNADPTAPQDFCAAWGEVLFDRLCTAHPFVEEHSIREAVHQTLFDFCKNPAGYDPERLDLSSFLFLSADRDLRNLLRKEQRRAKGRVSWNVVEDGLAQGKYCGETVDPLQQLILQEQAQGVRERLDRLSAAWTEDEKRVLDLILRGERCCQAHAEALGLQHLPAEQQQREVKRVKDRIKKRLEREGLC